MWSSDLYACEVLDRSPAEDRLPIHLAPAADEALSSWFCRLGSALELSPLAMIRQGFGIDSYRNPDWWRRPRPDQLAVIAAKGRLGAEQLRGITLHSWSHARRDENDDRFSARRARWPAAQPKAARALSVCLACLAGDDEPYIRRDWMIGWLAVCPRHRSILVDECPSCGASLRLPGLHTHAPIAPGRCNRCAARLAGGRAQPALDAAIKLQESLLSLKRAGLGEAPALGLIDWRAFTVIVDLVLHAVWLRSADYAREWLFERVVGDLEMASDERWRIAWTTNYGALVLMTWLLADDWPSRLTELLQTLRAPSIDDILARLIDLDDQLHLQVRALVGPASLYRLAPPHPGYAWLDSIAESGAELRARARDEASWPRQARILALALLREGVGIDEVAAQIQMAATSIERWLEMGAAYGLEVLIGKSLRRCDVPSDQLAEISAWLASVPCLSDSSTSWSAEHARAEVAARFGVLVSPAAISHLIGRNRQGREPPGPARPSPAPSQLQFSL